MENNFDLKKYDKKVALNYNFLASKKPESFSGAAWALYGETCHFSAGQKFPENADAAFEKIRSCLSGGKCGNLNGGKNGDLNGGENDDFSVTALSEALLAVIEYAVAFGGEGAFLCAEKICVALREKIEERGAELSAGEKCFISNAFSAYHCATNDEKAKAECLKILNEFGLLSESFAKSLAEFLSDEISPEELARLAKSALDMSVSAGEQKYKAFAAEALNYCLTKGLSLNYAAKNSFKNASYTSAAATSVLFSLCVKFYKITGDGKYSYFARRMWYNGLQFCQRAEGGAGEDSVACGENRYLQVTRYLNDRDGCYLAEALAVYFKNKHIFAESGGDITRDKSGRILMGDKIFAFDESGFFGKDLIEIPTMTAFDKDVALQLRLKI